MTDCFSTEKRREIMSRIRGADTSVELTVRKQLHRLGYRFRLHVASLPGRPDIVLPKYQRVIFVHGCFWHGHPGCGRATIPETNSEFWSRKINSNMARDKKSVRALRALDWKVLVLWQCQTKKPDELDRRLQRFLGRDLP
ncbi:MAG: very short patch repair endonuclease [Bryobacteraceae bacterium]|jgi:DNA mismatch endonuclease (patch repair protein)